jgi:cell division protein FtsL
MVAATVFAVVTLFGVVALHVLLNQGQLQLDHLQTQEARQEARAQKLRLDLAALQSPARVVAAARDRLGMVPPAGVTYVAPGVDGPALAAPPIVAPPTTDAPRTAAAARPAATPAPATPMTGIGAIPGLSAPPTPTPASPSPSATSSEAPHR